MEDANFAQISLSKLEPTATPVDGQRERYHGDSVAQVLVRSLDNDVVEAVRKRAARNGHSLEQELRLIIRNAVRRNRDDALRVAGQLRATCNEQGSDSTESLREDRSR